MLEATYLLVLLVLLVLLGGDDGNSAGCHKSLVLTALIFSGWTQMYQTRLEPERHHLCTGRPLSTDWPAPCLLALARPGVHSHQCRHLLREIENRLPELKTAGKISKRIHTLNVN